MAAITTFSRRTVVSGAALLFAPRPAGAAVDAAAFGAVGGGVADDTVALQRAIDALGPAGGTLRLAKGLYRLTDRSGTGACLTARAGIRIIGDGATQTILRPETPGADAVLITPNPDWAADFSGVEALMIGDHRTGQRTGRYGIRAVTRRGTRLPHFFLRDVYVGQGGAAGFAHFNDAAENENGGLYAATISGCSLAGGIVLKGSGDSIVIRENILMGAGIGIDAMLTPGASLLSVLDNNITSLAGAVRIGAGSRINILRNNCEHQRPQPGGVCIDITGPAVVGGIVAQNLLSCFTGSQFAALLRLRGAIGMSIEANSFAAGSRGVAGIVVGPGCRDIRVGPNVWNANVAPRLSDPLHAARGDPAQDTGTAE